MSYPNCCAIARKENTFIGTEANDHDRSIMSRVPQKRARLPSPLEGNKRLKLLNGSVLRAKLPDLTPGLVNSGIATVHLGSMNIALKQSSTNFAMAHKAISGIEEPASDKDADLPLSESSHVSADSHSDQNSLRSNGLSIVDLGAANTSPQETPVHGSAEHRGNTSADDDVLAKTANAEPCNPDSDLKRISLSFPLSCSGDDEMYIAESPLQGCGRTTDDEEAEVEDVLEYEDSTHDHPPALADSAESSNVLDTEQSVLEIPQPTRTSLSADDAVALSTIGDGVDMHEAYSIAGHLPHDSTQCASVACCDPQTSSGHIWVPLDMSEIIDRVGITSRSQSTSRSNGIQYECLNPPSLPNFVHISSLVARYPVSDRGLEFSRDAIFSGWSGLPLDALLAPDSDDELGDVDSRDTRPRNSAPSSDPPLKQDILQAFSEDLESGQPHVPVQSHCYERSDQVACHPTFAHTPSSGRTDAMSLHCRPVETESSFPHGAICLAIEKDSRNMHVLDETPILHSSVNQHVYIPADSDSESNLLTRTEARWQGIPNAVRLVDFHAAADPVQSSSRCPDLVFHQPLQDPFSIEGDASLGEPMDVDDREDTVMGAQRHAEDGIGFTAPFATTETGSNTCFETPMGVDNEPHTRPSQPRQTVADLEALPSTIFEVDNPLNTWADMPAVDLRSRDVDLERLDPRDSWSRATHEHRPQAPWSGVSIQNLLGTDLNLRLSRQEGNRGRDKRAPSQRRRLLSYLNMGGISDTHCSTEDDLRDLGHSEAPTRTSMSRDMMLSGRAVNDILQRDSIHERSSDVLLDGGDGLEATVRESEREEQEMPATRKDLAEMINVVITNMRRNSISSQEVSDPSSQNVAMCQEHLVRSRVHHRDIAMLELQAKTRIHAGRLLGREFVDSPIPVATEDEVQAFDQKRHEGPTMDNFRIHLTGRLRSKWNKRAAVIFSEDVIRLGLSQPSEEKKIQQMFLVHLVTLREQYRKQFRTPQESSQADLDKQTEENREHRRRSLRERRSNAVATHPQLARFQHIWDKIPYTAMSGDESDHSHGEIRYVVTKLNWRSTEFEDWLQVFDWMHLSRRFKADGKPKRGAFPRYRHRGSNRLERCGDPVPGLPMNCYNPNWLAKLHPDEQKALNIQPSMDISHADNVMAIARRFTHVRNGRTPPLRSPCDTF